MFLSFCLLLFCIAALFSKDNYRLYEKRNLTDVIKWIAAIAVVISHLFTFYMHNPTLAAECRFGSLSVSIFFFLSGYGLICSYSLKGEKYLKGFLIHRMGKVIIPLLTAYAIYIPLLKLINNRGGGSRSNPKPIFIEPTFTLQLVRYRNYTSLSTLLPYNAFCFQIQTHNIKPYHNWYDVRNVVSKTSTLVG